MGTKPKTGGGVAIRPCVADDLPAIERINAHYVRTSTATFEEEPPGTDYWRQRHREVTEAGLPFLVAEADGKVVGYACASRWRPRPGYRFTAEDSVYVAPGLAGRGIGTLLLAALLKRSEEAGVREVIAVIATGDGAASLALHRHFGFRQVGRLENVGFKFGRWLDTIVMQRSLGPDR